MIGEWYEVWADDSVSKPYLLIVTPEGSEGGQILVIDPKLDHAIIHHEPTYEAVKLWLLEDEYRRIEGRMIFDS